MVLWPGSSDTMDCDPLSSLSWNFAQVFLFAWSLVNASMAEMIVVGHGSRAAPQAPSSTVRRRYHVRFSLRIVTLLGMNASLRVMEL